MIVQLNIRNFAIIDRLSLSFPSGLNVLTGETGAGKTIILNAANLILGGRPSSDLIRTGETEMEVEAAFHLDAQSRVPSLLTEWGMEPSRELVVRRVVSRKGPNKVFINGSLATVNMLSFLGPHLMSIAGQYDQQILTHPDTHVDLLDEYAGLSRERELSEQYYNDLVWAIKQRKDGTSRMKRDRERLELLQFQLNEIQSAALEPSEDLELEAERSRLRHAEALRQLSESGYGELYGGDNSLVERAGAVQKDLERMTAMDSTVKHLAERLQSSLLELEDIAFGLRDYAKEVIFDPDRLEWVENRLAHIKTLGRKYGEGVDAILAGMERIREEIEGLKKRSVSFEELDRVVQEKSEALYQISMKISEKREARSHDLARKMVEELASLNMEKLVFRVGMEPLSGQDKDTVEYGNRILGPKGMESVSFLISPNPGEDPRPLSRIASGGELSRILLVLKSILAGKGEVEALVFDEVDSGIGGETAEKVGLKLKDLSRFHQVLCITHLPQIACFADHHFMVSKQFTQGRTVTQVDSLDKDSRVDEIARMLGGDELKKKARTYAQEMINRAVNVSI